MLVTTVIQLHFTTINPQLFFALVTSECKNKITIVSPFKTQIRVINRHHSISIQPRSHRKREKLQQVIITRVIGEKGHQIEANSVVATTSSFVFLIFFLIFFLIKIQFVP